MAVTSKFRRQSKYELGAAVNCSGPRAAGYSDRYHSERPAAAIVAFPRRAGTPAQGTGSDWGVGRAGGVRTRKSRFGSSRPAAALRFRRWLRSGARGVVPSSQVRA